MQGTGQVTWSRIPGRLSLPKWKKDPEKERHSGINTACTYLRHDRLGLVPG